MSFLGSGRLFKKPTQHESSDEEESYGTGRTVEFKPIAQRVANRLDATFQPRNFVTGSSRSQQEFYGKQEVVTEPQPSSSRRERRSDGGSGTRERELTADERNKLSAKIIKAEMMGNSALAKKLKRQLETGIVEDEQSSKEEPKKHTDEKGREEVLLTTTDFRTGLTRPLDRRVKHTTADSSIREMLAEERRTTAEDQLAMLGELANKKIAKTRLQDDDTIDDVVISARAEKKSKKRKREKEEKEEKRRRKHEVDEYLREQRTLDTCQWCFDSDAMQKHLIVATGLKTYLAVPPTEPLVDGHMIIVPMTHVSSTVQMDEDVDAEMRLWRKGLVAMHRANAEEGEEGDDCVFIETCNRVRQQQHTFIECIPLPQEHGDTAPIYFKKAMDEHGSEWTRENRRVLDLSKKPLRNSVPRGFPYVAVDFGLQSGYAHVIEDEKHFPSTFAHSIIGGMLDLEPNKWRRPRANIDDAAEYARKMRKRWQPFDWTERARVALREE